MSPTTNTYYSQQRDRWRRHDAHLWIRHDAARFRKPRSDPSDGYRARARERDQRAAQDAAFAGIAASRRALAMLRVEERSFLDDIMTLEGGRRDKTRPIGDPSRDFFEVNDEQFDAYLTFRQRMKREFG